MTVLPFGLLGDLSANWLFQVYVWNLVEELLKLRPTLLYSQNCLLSETRKAGKPLVALATKRVGRQAVETQTLSCQNTLYFPNPTPFPQRWLNKQPLQLSCFATLSGNIHQKTNKVSSLMVSCYWFYFCYFNQSM